MDNLWILVASRSGAQLLRRSSPRRDIELIREIDHPEGRLKNHEIESDAPGRVFSTGGSRSIKHGMVSHAMADERLMIGFAKQLARLLDHENALESFSGLVIVAGPQMLGLIRDSISKTTAERVVSTLDCNLQNFDPREIQRHLEGLLRQIDRTHGLRGMA